MGDLPAGGCAPDRDQALAQSSHDVRDVGASLYRNPRNVLTVGASSSPHAGTSQDQEVCAQSWADTRLGLLRFVGWLTLPTVLGMTLLVNYATHVGSLLALRSGPTRPRWGDLAIGANASGLMLIAGA